MDNTIDALPPNPDPNINTSAYHSWDATGIPELQRRLESACRQLGLAQLEEAKERCLEYLDGGLADYSQVTQSQMRGKEDAFLELWESILSKMSKDLESAKKAGLAALDAFRARNFDVHSGGTAAGATAQKRKINASSWKS
eukprot:g59680.t1